MPMKTTFETKRSPSAGSRPFSRAPSGGDRLRRDLLRRQVADEPLRAGVAERAGQRAADLARDAERAAVALGDVDALDLGASVARARRRHADQPLAGAVLRDLLGDDLGTIERVGVGKRSPQALADVRHVLEAAGAAKVDPVPELRGAHPAIALGHADF